MTASHICVLGSVNLDLVATGPELPTPGETVTGAVFAQHPGGKGANQALAARRLGAEVSLVARVGKDGNAEAALALLRRYGVDLSQVRVDDNAATGVALISVNALGENQIVVCPGANNTLTPADVKLPAADGLILQLEVPVTTVLQAAEQASGLTVLNLAPAMPVPDALLAAADVLVVNETEAAYYGLDTLHAQPALVVLTEGAAGARLFQHGKELARAMVPQVSAVDTTGAGDTFVAALTVALLRGDSHGDALAYACAAGAVSVTRHGAQPALPDADEVAALLAGA